jgi:SAM-dependent methyltransferase
VDRGAAARRPLLTGHARGALEHYADPAYYDQSYRDRISDVAFYVSHAVAMQGPVLEYGIGTGRVAIPIARHGIAITGVDHSAPMIDAMKARLEEEPKEVHARITTKLGDWRSVRLRKKFPLVICPFNGVLHLYTREDAEAFFARVRDHLTPNGLFVCDLNVPSLIDLARDPEKPYRIPAFRHPTAGVVKYKEYFDYDMATQVLTIRLCFEPKEGAPFEQVLTHRQYYPYEWENLLYYNGLEIIDRFGDCEGSTFDRDSDQLVCVIRKMRGWK